MNRFIFLVLMCLSSIGQAAIYKSINNNGEVVYSDDPRPGAVRMELRRTQNLSWKKGIDVEGRAKTGATGSSEPATDALKAFQYKVFEIASPVPDAYIRSNQGEVNVQARMEPDLRLDDRIRVILDGSVFGELQSDEIFALEDLLRGKHTLMLQVLDSHGKMLKKTKSVGFFMYRNITIKNKPFQPKTGI